MFRIVSTVFALIAGLGASHAIGAASGIEPAGIFVALTLAGALFEILRPFMPSISGPGTLMAVVSNNLIGAARNKIGNVVFSTWKGLFVLKNKPASVANPRTDAQVAQRSIITQLVALFRLIPSAVNAGFRQMAVGMSAYNAFVKYNAPEAFTITGSTAALKVEDLTMAKGSLGALLDFESTVDTGRTYDLAWTDNTGSSNANASDTLHVVVIDETGENVYYEDTTEARTAEAATITVPGSWSLTNARVIGFFVKADGSQACDSVNITLA